MSVAFGAVLCYIIMCEDAYSSDRAARVLCFDDVCATNIHRLHPNANKFQLWQPKSLKG